MYLLRQAQLETSYQSGLTAWPMVSHKPAYLSNILVTNGVGWRGMVDYNILLAYAVGLLLLYLVAIIVFAD